MKSKLVASDSGAPFGARRDLSRGPVIVVATVYAAWFAGLVWMAIQVASAR